MKRVFLKGFFWFILIFLSACQPKPTMNAASAAVEQQAQAYFATYAERSNWEAFCAYYREDLQFEDIYLQIELDSLWKFKRFYNWLDTGFAKTSPEAPALVVESLVCNDSVAVASVYFTPFYWYGQLIEPEWGMDATIWLFFDENQKIYCQIDWIEYDPSVMQDVINRIRKHGVQKVPDWLDLSDPPTKSASE